MVGLVRTCILSVLAMAPAVAHASDIADALSFAQEVMGDEILDGYELEMLDQEPDEALILVFEYDHQAIDPGRQWTPPPTFTDLGKTRLSYNDLASIIDEAAENTGLPRALIDAVIRTESGYRPQAVSRAGAKGLMQLMPGTASDMGVRDSFDPRDNVLGGARYLRRLFDKFKSLRLAVAAYNAGPGNVRKHGGVPPFKETKRYVEVVMRRYHKSRLNGLQ